MTKSKKYLEEKFDELKVNRFEDSTNLMRVQIDLFLNMLKESEERLNSEFSQRKFESVYFGSEKTLSEAGKDLIFSILETIDYEWERLIVKLLHNIEEENSQKLRNLEQEIFKKIDTFSQQTFTVQYDTGIQMEKLRAELLDRVKASEKHRKDLLSSLQQILERDTKQPDVPKRPLDELPL